MTNYKVYMIINSKNDKKYIGMTEHKYLSYRLSEHIYRSRTKTQGELHRVMKEIGEKYFAICLIEDNLTYEEACKKEKEYIMLYDTINNGYNIKDGGEGYYDTKIKEQIIDLYVNKNKSLRVVQKELNIPMSIIVKHLDDNNINRMKNKHKIRISAETVRKVKYMLDNNKTYKEIQKECGVACTTIIRLKKGAYDELF